MYFIFVTNYFFNLEKLIDSQIVFCCLLYALFALIKGESIISISHFDFYSSKFFSFITVSYIRSLPFTPIPMSTL